MAQDIKQKQAFNLVQKQYLLEHPTNLSQEQCQQLHLQIELQALTHDAIIICDLQQRIHTINPSAEILYGWSEHEIIGQNVHTLLQSRTAGQQTLPRDVQRGTRYWEGELYQRRRDGNIVIVHSRQTQLQDTSGQAIAIVLASQDITRQKELEGTVHDQLRAASIAQEVGLWSWDIIDNQGHMIKKGVDHTLGRSDISVLSYEEFLRIVHHEDRRYVQTTIENALRDTYLEYICEYRVVWPDHSIHWIWSHGHVLYDRPGHPKTIVGVSLDVTERHHYEEILQAKNRRINAILENIADGLFILDNQWRFIYLNTQAEQIMHNTRENLLGKNIWDEISDFQHNDIEEKLRLAREQQQRAHLETFYEPTRQWLDIQIYPTKENISVYCKDVTEYKLTEMALRASEEKFMQLVDSNIIAVAYSDHEGSIFEANEAFLSILGYTQQDIIQQRINWRQLAPSEYACTTKDHIRIGPAQPNEQEIYGKDGQRVPVFMAGTLIDKETQTAITLFVDMRPYREVEQQKEMFMSIVGHELRTPLTAINGSIQLAQRRMQRFLQQQQNLPPEVLTMLDKQSRLLEQSLRQTRVQNRLINDLLDISRLAVDKLELTLVPCDLINIVRETVEDICYTEVDHPINWQLPGQKEIIITADSERIGQVIANYVTNALKYSAPGTPVTIGIDVDNDQVRVWVRDEGPGLSEEAQKHIWDRYYRVEKDQQYKGVNLGLGLYICNILIQRHHGEVGVKSKESEGSCFWFSLPLNQTSN